MKAARTIPRALLRDALRGWPGVALGVALVAATFWLRFALGYRPGDPPMAVMLVLPVVIAARLGGRLAGLVATASVALGTKLLFIPPAGSLAFASGKSLLHWSLVVAVSLIATELVEHLRRERNLAAAAAARYQRFFDNLAEAAIILEVVRGPAGEVADVRIVDANPRAAGVLGRSREALRGRTAGEVAPGGLELVARARELHAGDRTPITREAAWGGRSFEVTSFVLGDGELVTTALERTEQRRLEAQFHQAQRLESVGRLAGGVAHDFNNIVTVVLSAAAALREDHEEGRPFDPALVEEIAGAGERARDLTRQLLAFARRQVANPAPLDVARVIAESERLLRRVLGEDVRLEVRAPAGTGTVVRADPVQLEQVLFNLAVNARDAMPRGGSLTIEVERRDHAAEDRSHPPGAWVTLTVRDDGAGMPPEVREHAFEPFFTTKEPGKGTGLGLATVHGIVEQSRGHVHLRSAPGEGTELRVCLPAAVDECPAEPAPAAEPRAWSSGSLLVVEDDPQVRSVMVRTLARAGYAVQVAAAGAEALALAREHTSQRIDLLVTDVLMPGMSGRDLAVELRRQRPGLQVLFVSGYSAELLAERELPAAELHVLGKPFTPAGLVQRVREILAGPPA